MGNSLGHLLFLVCYIRSTLNRLKFDELMINARIVILPTLLILLLLFILISTYFIPFALLYIR